MALYLLKVNIALAILYIAYRLLFREDTFFRLRRGALLSIYLIAFLSPLPDLSGWLSEQGNVSNLVGIYSELLPKETPLAADPAADSFLWEELGWHVLQVVWLTGIALLLFRCLAELVTLVRLHRRCRKVTRNGIPICLLPYEEEPYSFFRWIFIPQTSGSETGIDDILVHEATHARQWHSLDILLGEAVCILCWFNPFAWGLKREIGINHEYLADEEVMRAGFNKKAYQYHLIGVKHPQLAIANLYNHFSVLPLKRRIKMLNKRRTRSVGKVKYLALLPLAAGLLLVNNIDAMARVVNEKVAAIIQPKPVETVAAPVAVTPDDDKVYEVCDEMPMFPGGPGALLQFIAKNVKYPADAIESKTEGRVSTCFIVEKDGSISNVEVLRSVSPSLDAEAVRVIKAMPKWTPAKDKGKVVRVKYTVPVTFRLQ